MTLSQCNTAAVSVLGGSCGSYGIYYEVQSSSMTVEICYQICVISFGYTYAGLNQGYILSLIAKCFWMIYLKKNKRDWCACGDNFQYNSTHISSCNMACSGKSTEMCGDSTLLFSIYSGRSFNNWNFIEP